MLLTILKYLGLCLAAASSIWGTTQELTIKTPDNRKHLTKAGVVSILFVIIGLVLSIISDDIGRKMAAQDQYQKVAEEARRTNEIIIASQPLTSLSFLLQFESSDPTFRKQMEDGDREIQENNLSTQGGVPIVPFEEMEYEASLIPMLEFLGQLGYNKQENSNESHGIIALFPLDGAYNTILSLGEMNEEVNWYSDAPNNKASAGFSAVDREARPSVTIPFTTKKMFRKGKSKYAIGWDLDPSTLENAIDRSNTEIRSVAKLPKVLKIAILTVYDILPFECNNFARNSSDLWKNSSLTSVKKNFKNISDVKLSVQVNGFSEFEYTYNLSTVYSKYLYDNVWGDEIEIGCTMLEFKLDH